MEIIKRTPPASLKITIELTLEELIVIGNSLGAIKPSDYDRELHKRHIYTEEARQNRLYTHGDISMELYKGLSRELEKHGIIEPSWVAKFD